MDVLGYLTLNTSIFIQENENYHTHKKMKNSIDKNLQKKGSLPRKIEYICVL